MEKEEEKIDVQVESSKKETTQIGIHAVRNLLGSQQQLSLFSEKIPQEFSQRYGVKLKNTISEFGVELTELQQRVLEGILYGFSKTKYEGNVEGYDKEQFIKKKFSKNALPSVYDNVDVLPRLRMTQVEILKWAKVNPASPFEIMAALEALKHLATTQYCFYYNRLALDEKGVPIKDQAGKHQMESVVAIDTLLTIKEVRHKDSGKIDYYEVVPSTLFLDQREGYFLLIPFGWREEVRSLVGQRRASVYTFRFLLFLRYQFEMKRRSKKESLPYTISWSPEEIAITLKMPESVFRRKKARANQILEDAYSVAKQLGYLTEYRREGGIDVLILNEEKYYSPQKKEDVLAVEHDEKPELTQKAKELYQFMIEEKRKLLPKYAPPIGGQVVAASLNHLKALLSVHSLESVKRVVQWGFSKNYWVTRIGTSAKLHKNFNEAATEMMLSSKGIGAEARAQANKEYAITLVKKLIHAGKRAPGVKLEALNRYLEISKDIHRPICIPYAELGFREQVDNALRKVGLM